MALAQPRKIIRRDAAARLLPVAAGAAVIQSGLVILAGAAARPGRVGQGADNAAKIADASTYRAVGIALESVTGGAADGDRKVNVQLGCFNFKNSAGADAIALADVGREAFIVDDETVARTSGNGLRAPAGRIVDVDADGVWIDIGEPGLTGRTIVLPFAFSEADLLAGTSAELVSPVAGRIVGLTAIVQKAVTTGGPITALVGTTAVDGLSVAIADGAAKGAVVSDQPTAGHATAVVAIGARIQVAPDAAFATAGQVSGFIEILPA